MGSLSNTCEGSSGTAISNANSAGPNQFNTVTVTGTGTTLAYDNAQVHAGATAAKFSLATVSSTAFLDWSALPNTPTANAYVRFYAYLTALPSVNAILVKFLSGASVESSVQLQTTGICRTLTAAGGTISSLTESFPLNQWVRVEFEVTGISGVNGTVALRIFSGANLETGTPDSGGSVSASSAALTGTVTDLRVGTSSAVTQTSTFAYWYDDIAYSDVATPGPSVAAAVTWVPQRYGQPAPPWQPQQEPYRSVPGAVDTPANPLPSPLDTAWQASGGYWHLYGDTAARDRRAYFTQRLLVSDPSLLTGPAQLDPTQSAWASLQVSYGASAACAPRAWAPQQRSRVSDPLLLTGPAQLDPTLAARASLQVACQAPAANAPRVWQPQQRARISDPLLLTTAELENELLGGAGTVLRYLAAAYYDRREVPQQRAYVSDPSFYPVQVQVGAGTVEAWWGADTDAFYHVQRLLVSDPNLLAPPVSFDPVLGGQDDLGRRQRQAATHYDRREVPWQRAYISDPSFYPTVAPTDPLTIAWGAGGPYWHLYNRAADITDRREVPQQRPYVSDPLLLTTALLEAPFLGGGDTGRHAAWYTDRRLVPQQRAYFAAIDLPFDPVLGAFADLARRYGLPFTHADRRLYPQQRVYFPLPQPPPPFTIGTLTAGDKPGSTLTGGTASSALAGSTAPSGALTATDQRTGGPGG